MAEVFDVVVIGAGAAGENVADRAHRGGCSAAIVEADLVGGACSYWACMPSKALLRPGAVLAAARRVPGAAAAVTGGIDVGAALARRDEVVHHLDDAAQQAWVEGAGLTLVRGRARLTAPRAVEVATAEGVRALTARTAVVLATGSVPVLPPIPGLDRVGAWTSREATSATSIPRRLVVLGGGAVACEMAQAMRWLGSEEVTVVERVGHLLPGEEPFAGRELMEAFAALGITVRCGRSIEAVRRTGGAVTATLDDGTEVEADEILVAAGQRPATDDLGLEAVGLPTDEPIVVDDRLRVQGVEGGWLYAVGDVAGRSQLTHVGKYEARVAGDVIAGVDVSDRVAGRAVPRVVFTDPQVASVGRIEAEAREAGVAVRTVRHAIDVGGATVAGEGVTGTAQLVVDEARGVVVGATFTGPDVGELLHAATIAVAAEVPLEQLWHAVPAYPTVSEVWLRLLEAYGL